MKLRRVIIEIDLQFKGIDGSSVVGELHEEGVVLLKALGVCQGGGRLRKIVEIVQSLFPLKIVTLTMADLMMAGVLSTDFSLACPCESTLYHQLLGSI